MIGALEEGLRFFAADADSQLQRDASRASCPDEAAMDLADAWLLAESCQQIALAAEQRAAMEAVFTALEAVCGRSEPWPAERVRGDPRWTTLRRRAAAALRALHLE